MTDFVGAHWLDIVTTLLGLGYILLEYRASIWLWAVGFLMQALDIVLYYDKGLYADCGMEFYYIAMTVYGFLRWKGLVPARLFGARRPADGSPQPPAPQEARISRFPAGKVLPAVCITLALWAAIYWLLTRYTNSTVPLSDSFTTALSFVALWALARKYLEQWLLWIAVDAVTFVLYAYKGLPFKSGLYALYIVIAVMGYRKWRRLMAGQEA